MTNILTGGTASVSSQYSTYGASLVQDGNLATGWYTQAANQYFQYDLGAGVTKTVKSIRFYQWHHSGDGQGFETFKFEGSNDGSSWTILISGVDEHAQRWQYWSCPSNTTAYRYFRFTCITSPVYTISTLDELEAFETDEKPVFFPVDTSGVLSNGLVAGFKLSDANDIFGANNGTPTNISYSDAIINKGSDFNGSSSKIALPTTMSTGRTAFSCFAWVKIPNYSVYNTIYSKRTNGGTVESEFKVMLTTGKFEYYNGTTGYAGTTAITTGSWQHLGVTVDASGNLKFWINGSQDGSTQTGVSPGTGKAANCFIGVTDNVATTFNNGSMRDLYVWNRDLSATEIGNLYNGTGSGIGQTAYPPIEIDNATAATFQASGSTLTYAHTVGTGSNKILFVGAWGGSSSSGNVMTGITYNGVTMTQIAYRDASVTGDRWVYLFYLINPPSGSHNIVVTWSSSSYANGSEASSYFGAKQSSQPDAYNTNDAASGGNMTTSVTSSADNCWAVQFFKGNTVTTGTGSVLRAKETGDRALICDTGFPKTPTGSISMTVNSVTNGGNCVMASFAPASASTAYTVTIVQGAYTLTGEVLGLLKALKIALVQGAYTLSGQVINFSSHIAHTVMTMGQGAYTLTGSTLFLFKNWGMAMIRGTYTLTGEAVMLSKRFGMVLAQGAYTLTGEAVNFVKGQTAHLIHGVYVLTGNMQRAFVNGDLIGYWKKVGAATNRVWKKVAKNF